MKSVLVALLMFAGSASAATIPTVFTGQLVTFGLVHTIVNEAVKSQDREPCTYVRVEHNQGNIKGDDGKRYTERAVCK